MAFRPTLVRSIKLSVRLAEGLLSAKPEVEEMLRRNVFQTVKIKYIPPDLKEGRKLVAHVVSGPHSGSSPGSKNPDYRLHSTARIYYEDSKGEMQHFKTVHVYHDEEEYTQALQKVEEVNRM